MRGILLLGLLGVAWVSFAQMRSEQIAPQFVEVIRKAAEIKRNVDCDKIRSDELMCMACNIFFESGNQSRHGKVAVGAVTLNRVHHSAFPNSICGVVWQRGQFSWTNDGRSDKVRNVNWWQQSLEVAQGLLIETSKPHGAFDDPTNCALFYHATYIRKPYWVRGDKMIRTRKIEQHAFYKKPSFSCPFGEPEQGQKIAQWK